MDAPAWTGRQGAYSWLVAPSMHGLMKAVPRFHPGLRLCISACDSGPIRPNAEEQAAGWISRGALMVSPALTADLAIPYEGYDEWYVFDVLPDPDWKPEIFVNHGAFTLVPPAELYKSFDPTWERGGWDWLVPSQIEFWDQIERVRPVSYIAMGDKDIVVSLRHDFIEELRSDV